MEIDQDTGQNQKDVKPLVLVLIGLPGSGKSTFCEEVMKISARPWVRVCQDTINKGKSGTKNQCLSSAAAALNEGKSVIIDRCNIDRVQRAEFLNLGNGDVEKHALVLDLPVKLCISCSVGRSGHEGKLQGGKAAAVVNQMAQKKELPELSEGFRRISICRNENDVGESIKIYGFLGLKDSLPRGFFGQKNPHDKIQLGIMKFLRKADASLDSETSSENIPTLAFPSISTADFQFDLEKASDIIVEKVDEFVGRIGKARLVLVDLSPESKILALVKEKASRKNIDPCKFFTFVGDITQLQSRGGLRCDVIFNAANWRLSPGGGGVNAAIFRAAGDAFEVATKERAKFLSPGKSLIVPIPASSRLLSREGITHVIHVLGPNMNPMRPDCLNGDYVEGCKVLRGAYSSLLEGFVSLLESGELVSRYNGERSSKSGEHQGKIPTHDDHTAKRKAFCESDMKKKGKGSEKNLKKTWGSWALALYNIAMNPDKHQSVILEITDDFVVVKDAYFKAQRHVLVLARVDGLDFIGDVGREHIPLLRKLHDVGLKWAKKYIEEDSSLLFRLGYHSAPSMRQLHLHVISQDFNSSHFKNKKHWNSFNTPFFLDSVDVIKQLEETGSVTKLIPEDCEKFLNKELRCHRCESVHPTIPNLKSHVSSCKAPFPVAVLEHGRLVSAQTT